MAHSVDGTVFGIFGPWGSGKTSAVKAMQPQVLRAARVPLQATDTLATAYVDCSGLASAADFEVSNLIHGELAQSGIVKRSSALEKGIFSYFRRGLEIAKIAAVDPVSKVGMEVATSLAKTGERIADQRQRSAFSESAPSIEKAFIFLDDLDRCDANVAWTVLRLSRRALPKTKVVVAVVCDPVVLGHHISHVLGVPLASGFQAVLKYIDIPLRIPTAPRESHRASIRSRLEPKISEDWRLEEVAYEAIGSIPARDVLAALPQACIWLESWDARLRPGKYSGLDKIKSISEVVLFFALLNICIPNVAQVVASGKRDWLEFSSSFRAISHGLMGPMKDSTQSAIEREFGDIAQEVAAARMDLVRYGRSRKIGDGLTSVKAGEEDIWLVLWDMLRN
jgi:hypothetical protein